MNDSRNMKVSRLCMLLMAVSTMSMSAYANKDDDKGKADLVQAVRIKELNLRKAELQKRIKDEDKKRNRTLSGVASESQERLNEIQDSICLDLRSRLVSVELELKELVPDKTASVISSQLSILQNQQHSETGDGPEGGK